MKKAFFCGAVIFAAFILMGCPNDNGNNNNEDPPQNLQLNVTGDLPAAIIGASLMNPAAPAIPVAVGVRSGTTSIFNFFVPGAAPAFMPTAEPFTTSGTYLIGLAEVNMSVTPPTTVNFVYMPNPPVPGTRPFSLGTTVYVPWSAFIQQP